MVTLHTVLEKMQSKARKVHPLGAVAPIRSGQDAREFRHVALCPLRGEPLLLALFQATTPEPLDHLRECTGATTVRGVSNLPVAHTREEKQRNRRQEKQHVAVDDDLHLSRLPRESAISVMVSSIISYSGRPTSSDDSSVIEKLAGRRSAAGFRSTTCMGRNRLSGSPTLAAVAVRPPPSVPTCILLAVKPVHALTAPYLPVLACALSSGPSPSLMHVMIPGSSAVTRGYGPRHGARNRNTSSVAGCGRGTSSGHARDEGCP